MRITWEGRGQVAPTAKVMLDVPGLQLIALVLLVGGLGLRWWAILTLGRLFTMTMAVLLVLITAVALHRIRVEEAALARALGEPYLRYREGTKRLIPGVS